MKLKLVVAGLLKEYALEEINILSEDEVIFSDTITAWKNCSTDMAMYKIMIEKSEVRRRMIFNRRKAFLFIQAPVWSNPDTKK